MQTGYACAGGAPSVCSTICGDGLKVGGEACDDGNNVNNDNNDGCSSVCAVQPGYVCLGTPSVCGTVCGDSIIAGAETCDDANAVSGRLRPA